MVTNMVKYLANIETGILFQVDEDKEQESNYYKIYLMEEEEFDALQGDYPHKKNLSQGLKQIQYCKIETFKDCIQGTMKVPKGDREQIALFTFGFYVKGNELFFLGERALLGDMLEKISGNISNCTLNQILLVLFEMLIEEDVLYLQTLEEYLSDMEEKLLLKIPDHFYETIIQYRKKLTIFHSYYEQLINIGDQMQANVNQEFSREECAAWQIYANRTERLHNHVEALREYLIQIRELYQSQIDVRQNKVMSILTIITAFFLPLTLLVGWYGMNFPGMPEFRWKYGYPAVIILGIVIILAEFIYFKKKKLFR
ncbi:magnesium transporter [Kineothrix alysoides]|uniref:Magnesium transporter n=2 Tax=Kineothrix alysoides TaxID=1469948 RepID=A0A4R1QV51_9FIRM|nr:magnesium transporter [Kineothrix alysoides]